jgi:uncharacterized protein
MCKTKLHKKQNHEQNHGKTNVKKQTVQQLSENMLHKLKHPTTPKQNSKNYPPLIKNKKNQTQIRSSNMKTTEDIKKQLETLKPVLKDKYQVETIGIFGSYTSGEQTKKSDIDVLVEFSKDAHIGFFKFLELEEFLTQKLGIKVDLVTKNALKPMLKDQILKETVRA